MSTSTIRPNTPLNINLVPPPVGNRTTITLDSSTLGVSVTTESSLISTAPPVNPGIIGAIVQIVKRVWTKICNWILYVIRFFIPASALPAITQIRHNIEESNRAQRTFIENQFTQFRVELGMNRPAEPPALASQQLATSLSMSPTAPSTEEASERLPSQASLDLAKAQKSRLFQAVKTLFDLKPFITSETSDSVKKDFDETFKRALDCLQKLDDLKGYSKEGEPEQKAHTSISELEDVGSIEAHTRTAQSKLNPQ